MTKFDDLKLINLSTKIIHGQFSKAEAYTNPEELCRANDFRSIKIQKNFEDDNNEGHKILIKLGENLKNLNLFGLLIVASNQGLNDFSFGALVSNLGIQTNLEILSLDLG